MASEYKLDLQYKSDFHDVYAEHCDHEEYGPLLQRMFVVDAKGKSQMDEDQWETASSFFIRSRLSYALINILRYVHRIRLQEAMTCMYTRQSDFTLKKPISFHFSFKLVSLSVDVFQLSRRVHAFGTDYLSLNAVDLAIILQVERSNHSPHWQMHCNLHTSSVPLARFFF